MLEREAGKLLRAVGEIVVLRCGRNRGRRLRVPVTAAVTVDSDRPLISVSGRVVAHEVMTISQEHEALWREHRERLYRFVVGRVSDAATAEDIVHDVLVRAYRNRDTLRNEGKFEQWLYQITRNAVVDYYRARKPATDLPENLPEPESEHGRQAQAELARCIQPFVSALPPHYRDAVELAEIRGLTQQQTAAQLGLSLSGAKSRVQRGRRMLADMVLECCRVEFDSAGGIMSYESRRCEVGGTAGGGCGDC